MESSVESKINQNVASYPQADEADASAPMQGVQIIFSVYWKLSLYMKFC